ncbi:MAG: hypothetical protein ACR2N4_05250 [Jatrophihabitans sp.]
MARHAAPDGDLVPASQDQAGTELASVIRLAIHAAGRGDPQSWQLAVQRAVAGDLAAADALARRELADRVRRQGVETGMVAAIAHGAMALSAAAEDGPFSCPAYLFELAIRRALDEPGCMDQVDAGELVYAATQCAGLLDIHDALLPPGWGWAIHLPLPQE